MTESDATTTVYTIYIRAPRAAVWAALTETGTPRGWLYGTVTTSDWTVGGTYTQDAGGFPMIGGDVRVVDEPARLTLGFDAHWDADVEAEPPGVLDYRLEDADDTGGTTRLTVTLSGLVGATAVACERDTPQIYSSLKSVLETGEPL